MELIRGHIFCAYYDTSLLYVTAPFPVPHQYANGGDDNNTAMLTGLRVYSGFL